MPKPQLEMGRRNSLQHVLPQHTSPPSPLAPLHAPSAVKGAMSSQDIEHLPDSLTPAEVTARHGPLPSLLLPLAPWRLGGRPPGRPHTPQLGALPMLPMAGACRCDTHARAPGNWAPVSVCSCPCPRECFRNRLCGPVRFVKLPGNYLG